MIAHEEAVIDDMKALDERLAGAERNLRELLEACRRFLRSERRPVVDTNDIVATGKLTIAMVEAERFLMQHLPGRDDRPAPVTNGFQPSDEEYQVAYDTAHERFKFMSAELLESHGRDALTGPELQALADVLRDRGLL